MTEKQLIIQRYFKQYYKDNKSKIKAANRNRYFKDHENRKAYGRAQQKVYYQNEKEKLIKEVVDRVRVKFFDEEFIPEEEEVVIKKKRKKFVKRKTKQELLIQKRKMNALRNRRYRARKKNATPNHKSIGL